ncbi:hypothetical protein DYB32_010471 [Aphanomyces invadans]|uniref:Peptidase C19 ubiquitin carboxyl-terminal hydrolase domain-containing protein n=1 Tax=Aphanomyces invadans TaxID=157072 RepID=A0A3R6ZH75_9STRA|nr:hypothetical protein DYB32_010471 [Aphanomyces invadans]
MAQGRVILFGDFTAEETQEGGSMLTLRDLLCLLSAKAGDINVTRQPLVGWKHLIQLIRELDEPTLAQQMTMKQQHKKPAAPVILSPHFLRLFQSANGMQQDALEFLEFLLDHLHVDFETSPCSFPLHAPASPHDDGWAEIQKHGKASIVHHNIVENHSPITFLFKGTLRSELIRVRPWPGDVALMMVRAGGAQSRRRHDRAIPLPPLDHAIVDRDAVPDDPSHDGRRGTTVRTNTASNTHFQVLEPSTLKRTTFETLPVVLTLHVKRFTYDAVQGPLKLDTVVQVASPSSHG